MTFPIADVTLDQFHLENPGNPFSSFSKPVLHAPDSARTSNQRYETHLLSRWRSRNTHAVKFDYNLGSYFQHFQPRTSCLIICCPLLIRANTLLRLSQIISGRQRWGPPLGRKWHDLFSFHWCIGIEVGGFFLFLSEHFLLSNGLQENCSTMKQVVFQVKCSELEVNSVWLT